MYYFNCIIIMNLLLVRFFVQRYVALRYFLFYRTIFTLLSALRYVAFGNAFCVALRCVTLRSVTRSALRYVALRFLALRSFLFYRLYLHYYLRYVALRSVTRSALRCVTLRCVFLRCVRFYFTDYIYTIICVTLRCVR